MKIAGAARLIAVASLASGLLVGAARADMSLGQALAVEPYPAPPATPSQVLLRNATVWTQTTEGILEGTDVLIENGRIKALGRGLKAAPGALVVDATGRHVTPGIIDMHAHVAHTHTRSDLSLHQLVNTLSSGVTTVVDAGSAGADTINGFRKYVIETSATRILAHLNISSMGMIAEEVGELDDIKWANVPKALAAIERHRDLILGV